MVQIERTNRIKIKIKTFFGDSLEDKEKEENFLGRKWKKSNFVQFISLVWLKFYQNSRSINSNFLRKKKSENRFFFMNLKIESRQRGTERVNQKLM